ncbi:MAG: pbpF 1 [Frankiales bacterium]|nr:pbpF 1 [Frankiales bacterium]
MAPTAHRRLTVRPRRRRRRSSTIARGLLLATLCLLVGACTFIGGLLAAPIDFAVAPPPTAAVLLAADGRQLATILPSERREDVKAADIPQVMRDAIISAEDERFLKHSGVDPLATVRAAFRDLTGGSLQGGSTLTQQYVKNAYVSNERSALRKIREAALAVRLEQKLSKDEILTDYLNALYLGNGLYGVQAASKYYFNVPVKDLDLDRKTGKRDPILGLARASMMAGIAPAPSVWNPVKDFKTARIRQQYTLNRMVVGGYASPQQVSDAYHLDVTPQRISPPVPPNVAPEFVDYVTAKIKADLKAKSKADPTLAEDLLYRGGLRITSTLDLDLQQAFRRAMDEVLSDGAKDPQAAIVAVDYRNGDIKAMATARRAPARVNNKTGVVTRKAIASFQPGGFNLSTAALRSSGSTIKPFTLAQALIDGQTLSTARFAPNCLSIRNPGGTPDPYRFCNSDKSESGTFSLRRALADSVNTVYLPLAKEIGRGKVAALAQKAGLSGLIKPGNLSFGIGAGVEITPLSEAVAYGTFANNGVHVSPRSYTELRTGAVGTDQGHVLDIAPKHPGTRVMKASVAQDVVKAMVDVVQQGTGTAARQPFPVFGKTGTTNDSTDAWFTGCIPDQHICVATWMGYEDISCRSDTTHVVGTSCGGMKGLHGVRQVFGGTLPAKIFARSQQLLREIKAARKAGGSGILPSATPAATRSGQPVSTATATTVPTATKTAVPSPTPSPTPTPLPSSIFGTSEPTPTETPPPP